MENALFKLELDVVYPISRTVSKYFKTLKTLRQYDKRNDFDNALVVLEKREYILTDSGYERFYVFFNRIVPLSELIKITTGLIKSEESKSSIFKK